MMNDIKKNELNEQEIENVSGGSGVYSRPDFVINAEELHIWNSLTLAQQLAVMEQPDKASRRAAMYDAYKGIGAYAHGGGASGRW